MKKDYYEILGVSPKATAEEIKNAFHKLFVKYNPQKKTNTPEEKQQNESKLQEITNAYQTLKNPEARKAYDQQILANNFFGESGNFSSRGFSFDTSDFFGGGGYNINDILSFFFQGKSSTTELKVTITRQHLKQEFISLEYPVNERCKFCSGSGYSDSRQHLYSRKCIHCSGRGERKISKTIKVRSLDIQRNPRVHIKEDNIIISFHIVPIA